MTYRISIINYTLAYKSIARNGNRILQLILQRCNYFVYKCGLHRRDGIKIQINTNLYNNAGRSTL